LGLRLTNMPPPPRRSAKTIRRKISAFFISSQNVQCASAGADELAVELELAGLCPSDGTASPWIVLIEDLGS
jgi:hypothetical protein